MSKPADNMHINSPRLWESLMEMAKIGPGVRGGNNRQTLTDEDAQGRYLFKNWCEEAGMTVGIDSMGNMFARHEGTDSSLLPVMVGSHLDTQPTGGKYDGVLGVLAGLEIVRSLNDMGIKTKRSIEVVNWTNEEGTRFAPAMLSSGVFAVSILRIGLMTGKMPKASSLGMSLNALALLGMNLLARVKCMPCSNFISNRDRSLKMKTLILALLLMVKD